jgi:signal transduction histidine kinase
MNLESLPDGVLVLDAERRVVDVNSALLRLIGQSRPAIIGQDCGRCLLPRNLQGKRLLDGAWPRDAKLPGVKGLAEQTILVRRSDDRDVEVTVTGSYCRDEHGVVSAAILCFRPGFGRRRASVSGMEIVSTVSHELRSPLTSVKGYTSLIINRWDRLTDEQKRMMLSQVNHDADRVTRLITELLDISRLESGRMILRRQLVDLSRLASSVVEKVKLEYPELDAETRFPADFPSVYADADKIEQVLTNLVENACKYGSSQGLVLEGKVDGDLVAVSVADHGEGIPESDLPKVFNKFFHRAEGRPTGSGLGLWISRGLVESHGGELQVTSIRGQGATFRFTLPLIDVDELLSR